MGDLRFPDEGGDIVPARSDCERHKSLRPLIPVIISTGGGGITLPLLQENNFKFSSADEGDDVDTTMMLSADPRVFNPTPLRWYSNYYYIPAGDGNLGDDEDPRGLVRWPKLVLAIESRGGSRPVFLYSKRLEGSDVRGDLNRLFWTKREALMEFLDAAEAAAVDEGRLRILGVDGGGKPYNLGLKKWHSLNMTVINCDWNKLVAANNANKGDFVRIWGFRHNHGHGHLGLAITFN